jgi:hypothetical protein
MADVSSFNQDPIFSEYSPYGRNYGNPGANLLMRSLFGFNYAPKPQNGQGMYDAYFQRERSREFYNIQKEAFSNNMLFRAGGLDPASSMMKFGSGMFSNPDGMVSRMLSPLIGGNPMAAQMQLYAGLNGANVMGAFGRIEGVSKGETDRMMQALEKSFYKTKPYAQVAKEADESFRQDLSQNPEYARQMGVGVPSNKEGEVDLEASEALKTEGREQLDMLGKLTKTVSDFEIADDAQAQNYNPELSASLGRGIAKDFENLGFSKDQLSGLFNGDGQLNSGVAEALTQEAGKNVRTKDDYKLDLIESMADKMGLPKNSKRSATLRGEVPTIIDGQEVPAELLTQEQRDSVDAARALAADMLGTAPPPRIDPSIPAAASDTYADIAPATDPATLKKKQEGLDLVNRKVKAFNSNEKNRKFSESEVEALRVDLEGKINGTDGNPAPLGASEFELPGVNEPTIAAIKTATESAVSEITQTSGELDKNELRKNTKDYDAQISKALNERLKKQLKESFNVTEAELNKNIKADGNIDTAFVKEQGNKQIRKVAEIESLYATYAQAQSNRASEDAPGFDPQKRRDIDADMRKQLEGLGVSFKDLSGATRDDGTLDPAFVKEQMAKLTENAKLKNAGVDPEKIKDAKISDKIDQLRSNQVDRLVKTQQLERLEQERNEAVDDDKKDIARESQRKIRETLKSLGVSDSDIDDNTETEGGFLGMGGVKKINQDFLDKKKQEARTANKAERDAEVLAGFKKAGGKYAGINFEKTRGFELQDFTSGFTAAADLRLLGGKDTPEIKASEFAENAGGAMSAARGIFGDNLSGGQLVGKISEMLGSKTANLGSQEGSQEVEKMLRDVKATARVAGISIDSLLGVIDSAREVAKNNPRLKSMSAASTTEMSMKSLNAVSSMAGVMSSTEYRRSGGTQEMLAKNISEQQELLSSEAGQGIVALQQAYEADPAKKAAVQRVLAEYKDKGFRGGQDYQEMIKKLQEQDEFAGESTAKLYGIINSTTLRQKGMQNEDIVREAQGLVNKSAVTSIYSRTSFTMDGFDEDQAAEEFKEYRKQNPEGTFADYMSNRLAADPAALEQFGKYESTMTESMYRKIDPEYFKRVDARRDQLSKLDADLDKKFAARNAPVITQLASTLAEGGELDSKKTGQLLSVFADQSLYSEGESRQLVKGFEEAIAGASVQNAKQAAAGLSEATGQNISEEELKNMVDAGRFEGSREQAQNKLRELKAAKKNGQKLSDTEQSRLQALESAESLGILEDDEAYKTFTENGQVSGVVAASINAEKNKKNRQLAQEQKGRISETLGADLQEKATLSAVTSPEQKKMINSLLSSYTDSSGKVDYAKLMKDEAEGTGVFDPDSAEGKGFDFSKGAGSEVKKIITQANAASEEVDKKATSGEVKKDGTADLSDQLKDLVKAFNGSKLTEAIEALAREIK